MRKQLTVVSVNSRKGGVGKSSIALSAAAQLAASGKRVAFIDLDAMGVHLSQCLPIDGVAAKEGEHLTFRSVDDRKVPPMPYAQRPYLFWWVKDRPQSRGKSVLGAGERLLASDACVAWARDEGVADRLETMIENLRLFLMSCFVSDLDEVNQMMLRGDTQRAYTAFLTALVEEFSKGEYDFVFIDNSPGFSLNGAMSLSWAVKLANGVAEQQKLDVKVWIWLVSLASWWEQGLLAYELNVYGEDIIRAHPVLIVNRLMSPKWLGVFEAGKMESARNLLIEARNEDPQAKRRLAELKSLFFNLPLWLGAERDTDDLLLDFVVPQGLRIAVLSEGDQVANAGSTGSAGVGDVSVVDPTATDPQDIVRRWGRRAEEFFARFFLPALKVSEQPTEAADEPGSFHSQVRTALVNPLLGQS
jgi:hypothetical protein